MNGVAKCPVCEGRGTMPADFYDGGSPTSSATRVGCRSCGGRGIVWDVGRFFAPDVPAPMPEVQPIAPITISVYGVFGPTGGTGTTVNDLGQ